MAHFRVTLSSSKASGMITHDGYLGKQAAFRIQRLSDRKTYIYEGHGGGQRFELRCNQLSAAGGVIIEIEESAVSPPDTIWREKIVNLALVEAERLGQ